MQLEIFDKSMFCIFLLFLHLYPFFEIIEYSVFLGTL